MLGICATLSVQYFNAQIKPIGNKEFGRIFDVTYDSKIQNRVYAITMGNHIIVSNDNGNTWENFYTVPSTNSGNLKDLKLIENGKSLSFISTRSLDPETIMILDLATKTISKTYSLPNESDAPWITSYDFNEGNTNQLIIDTNWRVGFTIENKSFVTYDGGNNWKELYYSNDNNKVIIGKVAFNPGDSSQLFLFRNLGAMDEIGGVWISTDKGDTWTKTLPGVPLDAFAFNPINSNEIFAGTGYSIGQAPEALYHSNDAGKNWQLVPINWGTTGILYNINAINFNPKNPQHIIILEEDEVVISFDGGNTWENKVYPYDNMDSYYYGLKTTFNPHNNKEVIISANYKPLISADGGKNFTHQIKTPYFPSDGNLVLVQKDNQKHLYYGVQFGWSHRDLNTQQEENYNLLPLNMMTNDSSRFFVDKNIAGRVYHFNKSFMGSDLKFSNEHGENPTTIFTTFGSDVLTIATAPNMPNKVWVSFFEGSDDGSTHNDIKQIDISNLSDIKSKDVTLPTTELVTKFLFPNSNSSNDVILTAGNDIYKTNNGGNNWTKLNQNDIGSFIFDIAQNPFNLSEYSIATENGVYNSKDAGVNWTQQSQEIVKRIHYSTTKNGNIIAINHNDQDSRFGVYYSTDSGTEWKKISDKDLEYISAASSDVSFDGDKALIYVGSSDLGLVTYDLNFGQLGTNEPVLVKNKTILYPNPATEVININTDKKINKVIIYDATGRLVKTSSENKILVSDFKSGIYFVVTEFADQTVINTKFIKK